MALHHPRATLYPWRIRDRDSNSLRIVGYSRELSHEGSGCREKKGVGTGLDRPKKDEEGED